MESDEEYGPALPSNINSEEANKQDIINTINNRTLQTKEDVKNNVKREDWMLSPSSGSSQLSDLKSRSFSKYSKSIDMKPSNKDTGKVTEEKSLVELHKPKETVDIRKLPFDRDRDILGSSSSAPKRQKIVEEAKKLNDKFH